MRIGKRSFRSKSKSKLPIEFGDDSLTSHAGLEVVWQYLMSIGFIKRLVHSDAEQRWRGDFRFVSVVLLLVGALLVGARRLGHVDYLSSDPLVARFSQLSRIPSSRSLSRSLKKMTVLHQVDIDELSRFVIADSLRPLHFPRLTLDMDGSVITTGQKVGGAARGYNPHNRKNPSYYPISIMLAQTGHVWLHENRPGSVHDSHDADASLRRAVATLRDELGHRGSLELRADSAFFADHILEACDDTGVEYAIKVPMWPWLNIKALVEKQTRWSRVDTQGDIEGFFTKLAIPAWNRTERIAIYRTRRNRRPAKGIQLDLFNPDDGYWEYSVVATNKSLGLAALRKFMNGRGVQEKTTAELKSGYAYSAVPTNHYHANTAWQKLNVLTHNIATSFQLSLGAGRKPRSLKRTASFALRSIATLRFEWLNKAGRLLRPAGRLILRLPANDNVRAHYVRFAEKLC